MLGEYDQLIRTLKDNSARVTRAVSDLAEHISRLTSSVPHLLLLLLMPAPDPVLFTQLPRWQHGGAQVRMF